MASTNYYVQKYMAQAKKDKKPVPYVRSTKAGRAHEDFVTSNKGVLAKPIKTYKFSNGIPEKKSTIAPKKTEKISVTQNKKANPVSTASRGTPYTPPSKAKKGTSYEPSYKTERKQTPYNPPYKSKKSDYEPPYKSKKSDYNPPYKSKKSDYAPPYKTEKPTDYTPMYKNPNKKKEESKPRKTGDMTSGLTIADIYKMESDNFRKNNSVPAVEPTEYTPTVADLKHYDYEVNKQPEVSIGDLKHYDYSANDLSNATIYQNNLQEEAKKYQYNEDAKRANTLSDEDLSIMDDLVENFDMGDNMPYILSKAYASADWEKKYGKSYEQIYEDYIADRRNRLMKQGEDHPILSALLTIGQKTLQTPLEAVGDFLTKIIAPESKNAEYADFARSSTEDEIKLRRAGIKENTGNFGDKVIDKAAPIADRLATSQVDKLFGLGGVFTGLSDYSNNMEELNLRPDMDNRKKALTAFSHGAIEGAGTAITGGVLDKIPVVDGAWGTVLNLLKAGGNAAIENSVSEGLEIGADIALNRENSQRGLLKSIYMEQGMSEEEATKRANADVASQIGSAALAGGIFGIGTRGITEAKRIPSAVKAKKAAKAIDASSVVDDIDAPKQPIAETPTVEPTKAQPETVNDVFNILPEKSGDFAIRSARTESGKTVYYITPSDSGINVEPGKTYTSKMAAKKALKGMTDTSAIDVATNDAVNEINNLNEQIPEAPNAELRAEQNAPVGESAPVNNNDFWGETADEIIPQDSYIRGEDYRAITKRLGDLQAEEDRINGEIKNLNDLLVNERLGTKAKEEMTPDERLEFLNKPVYKYTPEGERIKAEIDDLNRQLSEIKAAQTEANDDYSLLKANERLSQLDSYQPNEFVPASREKYQGFSTTKGQMNDNVGYDAQLVEMSPLEYIKRCAYDIFGEDLGTLESTIATRKQGKIDDYAQQMLEGAEFDTPYIDYKTHGQEGLHRALAAYKAGIDVIPVVVRGEPDSVDSLRYKTDSGKYEIESSRIDKEIDSMLEDLVMDDEDIEEFLGNNSAEITQTNVTSQEPNAPKPNEVPNVKPTEPKATKNEVPNVKSNKTTNKAQGGADVGNVPPTEVGKAGDIGNSPHTKTSEAYTNTGKRGGGWNKAEYSQYTDESKFQYEDQTERESIDKAINMIKKEGLDGFKDRVMGKERLSASEVDGLMMEWRILCKQARDIEAAGGNATKAWEESVKVFRKIQEQASNNAQALQAMAKWSRNTPEGMLAQAENILNGRTKVKKSAAQKVLDRFQKEHKGFKFSDEFVAHFLKEADKLKDLDPDSMEYKTAMADLGRQVNAQLPSKFSEKLTTLLMDNMLGNFRTLITRNAGGNIGLNAVEQLLQRPLAALIDMGLAKKTGKRTQVGLTKDGIVNYLKGFGKGLKEEVIDFKNNLHTSRSGEVTFEDAIAKNRHVFKEGGLLDRFYDKLIKHGLSVGDRPFYEAVYKQTLGDYQRLRERGQMGEFIQGLSDEEFNMYAEAAAKMNALAAVYQQDSTLASALLGFKNSIGDLSRGLVGVDVLSQFSMPFVKTPANVIERAIDYSPLGIIRNIARTRGEIKNDNFDQNRFANETSRNILGTAMMAGGAALANAGGMGGAFSEDKDEKKAQKDAGMIEYGMNVPDWVPALGGMQMDIGWVPVVGSNMVASAAATDAFKNGEGNALGNVAKGLLAGGKAQLDQSMFQGMQRLFGGSGSYDSDKNLFANMTDVFSSGLGQFVPSLLRQIGQVSDEYQRDLSNSNPNASLLFMDNYDLNSLANNLPVLRNLALAPMVDSQGELIEENQGRNVGMKILEDMILPGKISKVEFSALNNEANLIKGATNLSDAYMPTATRSLVDTDEHTLTNKEWADFEQKYYQEMTDIGTQIIKSDFYKESDYTEKNRLLKQAYDGIKSGASNEYNGKEVSGAAKAYVEAGGGDAGVKAVFDYVEKGAIANQVAEQTGYSSNSTAAKDIADDIIAGNTADATEAIEYAQSNIKPYVEPAKELGIEPVEYNYVKTYAGKSWSKVEPELPKLKELGGTNYSQYAHAVNYADSHGESISAQQFYDQTKRLDTDHSGGVSQDELINEFNAKGMKEAEVMRLWGMLALGKDGAETKSVPYIITRGKNKGKWGIK